MSAKLTKLEKYAYLTPEFMREILTQKQIKMLTCITRKNIYELVTLVEKIVMNTFGLLVVQKILSFGVDIILIQQ